MNLDICNIHQGQKFRIFEILVDGKSEVREFISNLEPKTKRKITRLIVWLSDKGKIQNITKVRHIEDGIYEIKADQARIFWFYDREHIILLTNGFIKKRRKADSEEIDRAKRLRALYLEEMEEK